MVNPHGLQLLTLGDLLLDVLVCGELRQEQDDSGVVQLLPGGSAASFAAAAVAQGAQVRFVGVVGDDTAGRLLIADLHERGIAAQVRVVPDAATGTVLVLRDFDGPGRPRMWSNPGASLGLRPSDLDPALFHNLDGFHLTGYSLLRPDPRPAARHAVALARATSPGVLFSLDPHPAHLLAEADPPRLRALLAEVQPDLLFPNLEEGRLLAGADDPALIADQLLAVAPLVVLKLGAAGCLVAWGTERRHIPAQMVAVVDATGAGDAFAAGFVTTYLRLRDPLAAAQAGTAAAAAVVARPGAR